MEVGEETSGSGCASQAKQSKKESKKQQEEEKGQAAAMPASPNLFKVLTAEDPKSLLEDEIGCMTGIFQIFDRSQAFTGRRYGSKRVTSAAGNKIQSHPTFLPCLPSLHTHSHSCHLSTHIPIPVISPHTFPIPDVSPHTFPFLPSLHRHSFSCHLSTHSPACHLSNTIPAKLSPVCIHSWKKLCKALTPMYSYVKKKLILTHVLFFYACFFFWGSHRSVTISISL